MILQTTTQLKQTLAKEVENTFYLKRFARSVQVGAAYVVHSFSTLVLRRVQCDLRPDAESESNHCAF
jgi:hypothetical protein